jgi:hypothetical protein
MIILIIPSGLTLNNTELNQYSHNRGKSNVIELILIPANLVKTK